MSDDLSFRSEDIQDISLLDIGRNRERDRQIPLAVQTTSTLLINTALSRSHCQIAILEAAIDGIQRFDDRS
jgi:hypothetical protein